MCVYVYTHTHTKKFFYASTVLQMATLNPSVSPEAQQGTPLLKLLKDPYILIAAGK